jgi:hypothetical protein
MMKNKAVFAVTLNHSVFFELFESSDCFPRTAPEFFADLFNGIDNVNPAAFIAETFRIDLRKLKAAEYQRKQIARLNRN